MHAPSLQALESIWGEAEAGKSTTVFEVRVAILSSKADFKSACFQAVDAAEIETKLRVEAI